MDMATEHRGSGVFVPVKEWSCPLHDTPQTHYCDCDLCTSDGFTCDLCAEAEWRDKLDAEGNVVLRELSVWEQMIMQVRRDHGELAAVTTIFQDVSAKAEWLEDEMFPRVVTSE